MIRDGQYTSLVTRRPSLFLVSEDPIVFKLYKLHIACERREGGIQFLPGRKILQHDVLGSIVEPARSGGNGSLSQYKGQVVMLNFWASWIASRSS